jgi:hypothetical protein
MKQFLTTFSASALAFVVVIVLYQMATERQQGRMDFKQVPVTEDHEAYQAASVLADGLGRASDLKFLIMEFWAMEGQLPCTNEQLAFNAAYQDPVLKRVELTDCGEVTLTYQDNVGIDSGRMILRAAEGAGLTGSELQWDCTSPDFSGIETFMPQCRYEPVGR